MKTIALGIGAWALLAFLLMATLNVANDWDPEFPAWSFLGCFAVVGIACVIVGLVRRQDGERL